mmetsp:Transcript_24397/g.75225  ORF Transcript_24397/g.75225 Transcript_24397/m.75225 type:complete len:296 (+) Transcript_24397:467-1354(+)
MSSWSTVVREPGLMRPTTVFPKNCSIWRTVGRSKKPKLDRSDSWQSTTGSGVSRPKRITEMWRTFVMMTPAGHDNFVGLLFARSQGRASVVVGCRERCRRERAGKGNVARWRLSAQSPATKQWPRWPPRRRPRSHRRAPSRSALPSRSQAPWVTSRRPITRLTRSRPRLRARPRRRRTPPRNMERFPSRTRKRTPPPPRTSTRSEARSSGLREARPGGRARRGRRTRCFACSWRHRAAAMSILTPAATQRASSSTIPRRPKYSRTDQFGRRVPSRPARTPMISPRTSRATLRTWR